MQNLVFIILDVFSILLAIAYIFLVYGLRSEFRYDPLILKRYDENWNNGPITDITTSLTSCPSGYENLISTTWPGNYEGCECSRSDNVSNRGKVYKANCTRSQMSDGCDVIPAQVQLPLSFWKGRRLCARRMKSNFWESAELVTLTLEWSL